MKLWCSNVICTEFKQSQSQVICCRVIVLILVKKNGIKVCDFSKLIPNLGNTVNYVVHLRNLQLYVSLGIKVVKIRRALQFVLILRKGCVLATNLKKTSLNLWLIVFMVKQWKI